jgi:hypothetical protein
MIKLTLGELNDVLRGLNTVLPKVTGSPSYWLAKATKKMVAKVEDFQKEKMEVVEQFGLKDEEGKFVIKDNQYQFASKEDEKAFNDVVDKLSAQIFEIDMEPIPFESFPKESINGLDVFYLDKFIDPPKQ